MAKTAQLYRMMTPQHTCPYGLKSKELLEQQGFIVEDHTLRSREETDAYKLEQDVKTTPQTFIDGKRVGGYDDLRKFFNLPPTTDELTFSAIDHSINSIQ